MSTLYALAICYGTHFPTGLPKSDAHFTFDGDETCSIFSLGSNPNRMTPKIFNSEEECKAFANQYFPSQPPKFSVGLGFNVPGSETTCLKKDVPTWEPTD